MCVFVCGGESIQLLERLLLLLHRCQHQGELWGADGRGPPKTLEAGLVPLHSSWGQGLPLTRAAGMGQVGWEMPSYE